MQVAHHGDLHVEAPPSRNPTSATACRFGNPARAGNSPIDNIASQ
jgi:hypothetical protein